MIILSDKYTLRWNHYNWQLDTKLPTNHHKSVDGFKIENRWFPNLTQVFTFIFDQQIKDCEANTVAELKDSLKKSLDLIEKMIYQVEKG